MMSTRIGSVPSLSTGVTRLMSSASALLVAICPSMRESRPKTCARSCVKSVSGGLLVLRLARSCEVTVRFASVFVQIWDLHG